MRLTNEQQVKIITLAKKYFGDQFNLYLFGSRVHDHKKGGDIDLFLEVNTEIDLETELKFLTEMELRITERKVDLVIQTPGRAYKPIFNTAKNEGIPLCKLY